MLLNCNRLVSALGTKYDKLFATFAIKFKLRRYSLGSNPLPVALPGFCRAQYSWDCFIQCPGGASQCPGGLSITVTVGPARYIFVCLTFQVLTIKPLH